MARSSFDELSFSPTALKRVVVTCLAVGVGLLVAVKYLVMLKPVHAREATAACAGLGPAPSSKTLGKIPRPELDFTVTDYTGKPVQLSTLKGRVVLVNFWASWCSTCEKEKHSLEDLQREFDPADLLVLKVASDSDWNKVKARFPDGTPLTVVMDPPTGEDSVGAVAHSYGVEKVPESFLVDRDGNIRFYFVNKRDWSSDVVKTCLRSVVDET